MPRDFIQVNSYDLCLRRTQTLASYRYALAASSSEDDGARAWEDLVELSIGIARSLARSAGAPIVGWYGLDNERNTPTEGGLVLDFAPPITPSTPLGVGRPPTPEAALRLEAAEPEGLARGYPLVFVNDAGTAHRCAQFQVATRQWIVLAGTYGHPLKGYWSFPWGMEPWIPGSDAATIVRALVADELVPNPSPFPGASRCDLRFDIGEPVDVYRLELAPADPEAQPRAAVRALALEAVAAMAPHHADVLLFGSEAGSNEHYLFKIHLVRADAGGEARRALLKTAAASGIALEWIGASTVTPDDGAPIAALVDGEPLLVAYFDEDDSAWGSWGPVAYDRRSAYRHRHLAEDDESEFWADARFAVAHRAATPSRFRLALSGALLEDQVRDGLFALPPELVHQVGFGEFDVDGAVARLFQELFETGRLKLDSAGAPGDATLRTTIQSRFRDLARQCRGVLATTERSGGTTYSTRRRRDRVG